MWSQIPFVIILTLAGADPEAPPTPELQVETAYLRVVEQVEVSAQANGVIEALNVREGDLLTEGTLLAVIELIDAKLAH